VRPWNAPSNETTAVAVGRGHDAVHEDGLDGVLHRFRPVLTMKWRGAPAGAIRVNAT
jgi:hypothetical protein